MNHYKDPYQSTSIMESKRVFFVAQMVYRFFGALRISWDPDQWKGLLEPEFRRGVLVLKIAACVLRGGVRILRVGYFFWNCAYTYRCCLTLLDWFDWFWIWLNCWLCFARYFFKKSGWAVTNPLFFWLYKGGVFFYQPVTWGLFSRIPSLNQSGFCQAGGVGLPWSMLTEHQAPAEQGSTTMGSTGGKVDDADSICWTPKLTRMDGWKWWFPTHFPYKDWFNIHWNKSLFQLDVEAHLEMGNASHIMYGICIYIWANIDGKHLCKLTIPYKDPFG